MTAEEVTDELTTVSITPDGRVEMIAPKKDIVDTFLRDARNADNTSQQPGDEGQQTHDAPHDSGQPSQDSAEPSGSGASGKTVIGTDQRKKVEDTNLYPYHTMGKITLTVKEKPAGCTGTLIGPYHVLTAAHCVWDLRKKNLYNNINFSLGQNGSHKPDGTSGYKRILTVKGYTDGRGIADDYAVIVLDKPVGVGVGQPGNIWLDFGWKRDATRYSRIDIAGYPVDKPFGTMWRSDCGVKEATPLLFFYQCDTFGGESGSAVYTRAGKSGNAVIYGIHVQGFPPSDPKPLNAGTRITQTVFKQLQEWKGIH